MRPLRIPAIPGRCGLVLAACGSGHAPWGALTGAARRRGRAQPRDLGRVCRGWFDLSGVRLGHRHSRRTPAARSTRSTDTTRRTWCSLMATGQYDGVSASGDATLRMIAAGTVAPVNVLLIPNYAGVFEKLKNTPLQLGRRGALRRAQGFGANVLLYNTDDVRGGADQLGSACGRRIRRRPARSASTTASIYIADAAMRLMQQHPDLGITQPVPAQPGAVRRGGRPAAGAARDHRRVLELLHRPDHFVLRRATCSPARAGSTSSTPSRPMTSCAGRRDRPGRGCHRLVRHLDDREGRGPSWLHVPLDELGARPGDERDVHHLLRRGTGQPGCLRRGRDDPGWRVRRALRDVPRHRRGVPVQDQVLGDAAGDCNDDDDATTCKDIEDWIQAWTEITGA